MRVIEAKWLSAKAKLGAGLLGEVADEDYSLPQGGHWRRRSFLVVSAGVTDGLRKEAGARDVGVIELADLF